MSIVNSTCKQPSRNMVTETWHLILFDQLELVNADGLTRVPFPMIDRLQNYIKKRQKKHKGGHSN